jgi:AcrR family transcriptional regulator
MAAKSKVKGKAADRPANPVRAVNKHSRTAQQIMLAAEHLFGQRGIDGVSLREIAARAGQGNNSAVQYYFGTKENLVQSVFEMRMPALDAARGQWLEEVENARSASVRDLAEALLMPILDAFDQQGLENFAHFVTRLAHRDTWTHPSRRARELTPVTDRIVKRLEAGLGYSENSEFFMIRLRLAVDLFMDSIEEHKRLKRGGSNPYKNEQEFWRDIMVMVTAILESPGPSPSL